MKPWHRRLLTLWSLGCLVLAGALVGTLANAASNPPNVTADLNQQASAAAVVNLQSGVKVVYTNQYANLTFANGINAVRNVTWNPAVGPGWCVDGVCLNVTKSPATYPSVTVNVTQWNPTYTLGAVLILSLSVPISSAITFTLKNFAPGSTLLVTRNSAYYGQFASPTSGSATFTYFSGDVAGATLEFDIAPSSGTGGGGGNSPNLIFVRPVFLWRTNFALFNATSDQIVYFQDNTPNPAGASLSYLWKFGDGGVAQGPTPVHQYVFGGLSAAFNVTETVCAGSSCNITTTPITLVRWSTLELVLPLVALGVAGLYVVARSRRWI